MSMQRYFDRRDVSNAPLQFMTAGQPRDKNGKWTGGHVVYLGEDPKVSYPDAPSLAAPTDAQVGAAAGKLRMSGVLDAQGDVTLYHVTEASSVKGIEKRGLAPGAKDAPGQDWKAEHSSYAVYFHSSAGAAQANVQQGKETGIDLKVVDFKMPFNKTAVGRLLPDEDTGFASGLDALLAKDAVAFIGGVPAGHLRVQ